MREISNRQTRLTEWRDIPTASTPIKDKDIQQNGAFGWTTLGAVQGFDKLLDENPDYQRVDYADITGVQKHGWAVVGLAEKIAQAIAAGDKEMVKLLINEGTRLSLRIKPDDSEYFIRPKPAAVMGINQPGMREWIAVLGWTSPDSHLWADVSESINDINDSYQKVYAQATSVYTQFFDDYSQRVVHMLNQAQHTDNNKDTITWSDDIQGNIAKFTEEWQRITSKQILWPLSDDSQPADSPDSIKKLLGELQLNGADIQGQVPDGGVIRGSNGAEVITAGSKADAVKWARELGLDETRCVRAVRLQFQAPAYLGYPLSGVFMTGYVVTPDTKPVEDISSWFNKPNRFSEGDKGYISRTKYEYFTNQEIYDKNNSRHADFEKFAEHYNDWNRNYWGYVKVKNGKKIYKSIFDLFWNESDKKFAEHSSGSYENEAWEYRPVKPNEAKAIHDIVGFMRNYIKWRANVGNIPNPSDEVLIREGWRPNRVPNPDEIGTDYYDKYYNSVSLPSAKYTEMRNMMSSEEGRIKATVENLGQKYGNANNTYNNLVKILSSTIQSCVETAQNFLRI